MMDRQLEEGLCSWEKSGLTFLSLLFWQTQAESQTDPL